MLDGIMRGSTRTKLSRTVLVPGYRRALAPVVSSLQHACVKGHERDDFCSMSLVRQSLSRPCVRVFARAAS